MTRRTFVTCLGMVLALTAPALAAVTEPARARVLPVAPRPAGREEKLGVAAQHMAAGLALLDPPWRMAYDKARQVAAVQAFAAAVAIYRSTGGSLHLARALLGQARAHAGGKENAQAAGCGAEAVRLFRAAKARDELVDALVRLGDVYAADASLAPVQPKAPSVISVAMHDGVAPGAFVQNKTNQLRARACYDEALAILRVRSPQAALDLMHRATFSYALKEDPRLAVRFHEEMLRLARLLGDTKTRDNAYFTLPFLYRAAGIRDRGPALLEEALQVFRQEGREKEVKRCLSTLSSMMGLEQNYEGALRYAREAFQLEKVAGAQDGIFQAAWGVAVQAAALGQDEEASRMYDVAMSHRGDDPQRINWMMTRNAQMMLALKSREYPEVIRLADEVLIAADEPNSIVDPGLAAWSKALVLSTRHQYAEAIPFWGRVTFGSTRPSVNTPLGTSIIGLAMNSTAYKALAIACYRAGQPERALAVLEASRARVLGTAIAGGDPFTEGPPPDLSIGLGPDGACMYFDGLQADFEHPDVGSSLTAVPGGIDLHLIEDIRAPKAAGGSAGTLPAQRGVALGSPGAQLPSLAGPGWRPMGGMESAIRRFRSLLGNPSTADGTEARALGRLLYERLIAPSLPRIEAKSTWLICADGPFSLLPFDALIDEKGRFVAETHRIVYTPSLKVRRELMARKQPADRSPMLAIGGVAYQGVGPKSAKPAGAPSLREVYADLGFTDWGSLPGTLTEVKAIAKLHPGTTLLVGAQATESQFKQAALRAFRVVHLATHGVSIPGHPELSALVLSDLSQEGGEDGFLRPSEIADLRLAADFVNLSACESALGKEMAGEGSLGFPQAFLAAGANGVLATLWRIDDRATTRFMSELYTLAATEGASYLDVAVRTRRAFIAGRFGQTYRNPYYWAPFTYHGL